jgi:signal transduction histidine kinase/CheY-like chemotaxis protein
VPTPLHVLIAEDRPDDAELMVYELSRSGFEPKWTRVETEEDYLKELQSAPDVILADHTLPNFDAPHALRLLKKTGLDVPLIMVTGSISEEVAVERIKQGASDYILKDRMTRLGPAVKRALEEKTLRDEKRKADELIRRNLERIRALHEINIAITSTLDLRTMLNVLLEKIDLFLPFPSATTVRLLNRQTGLLESLACRNLDEEEWRTQEKKALSGRAKTVVDTKAPVIVGNVQTDPRTHNRSIYFKYGLVSYAGVPLVAKAQVLGILNVYTKEAHEFSDGEMEFLMTLADQAAIAIHNAQLYADMERSNKVKSEFLSVVSHELKTPLNVVISYASMIKDKIFGETNTEQDHALKKILLRADDQLKVINSILYATSLETQTVVVQNLQINLADFINDLRLSYPNSESQEPTIEWNYPPTLPDLTTDRAKLRQVIDNLIANAIKFTPKGKVKISFRYFAEREQFECTVEDNGIGIPAEMLPFIFDKFRQGDSSDKRSYDGIGLGLYIAKEFTRLLGGDINVQSVPERGTTFTVKLPC